MYETSKQYKSGDRVQPSNVFHYFSIVHPKPNELFSGSGMQHMNLWPVGVFTDDDGG